MAANEQQGDLDEAGALYDRYVRPLEFSHWGEFAAVAPDGRTYLGNRKSDVVDQLIKEVGTGSGSYIFRIGPQIVGQWR